jgi:glycosyltransferase involved in cell wall biosynthesis
MTPSLKRALRMERFDLIHAHNVLPTGDAVRRLTKGQSLPFIVSTHGPDIIHVAHSSPSAEASTKLTLQAASLVIANSTWAGRRCEALAGGSTINLRVVHLGADLPTTPQERDAREGGAGESGAGEAGAGEAGAGEAGARGRGARATIVTVAHLQARKGHASVLRALAAIAEERRPEYVIVGDGEQRGALEALARQLKLDGHVRFLGELEHRQALLQAWRADVCVMPSVEEPFGVAYVEAMAGGLPAIGCIGEGGPEDIAAAGQGMVLVRSGDDEALTSAIERCLEERDELGAQARETVARCFTWERCGRETVAAYEAALSAWAGGGRH